MTVSEGNCFAEDGDKELIRMFLLFSGTTHTQHSLLGFRNCQILSQAWIHRSGLQNQTTWLLSASTSRSPEGTKFTAWTSYMLS